jgi:uncharacterized membrane protein YraQ (UPF0718 family)
LVLGALGFSWGSCIVFRVVVAFSTAVVMGAAFALTAAVAANETDKGSLQQATETCRAQVKEQAKFHEMSWYARHQAVKNCVKESLAKH